VAQGAGAKLSVLFIWHDENSQAHGIADCRQCVLWAEREGKPGHGVE
jgi:hypothetical protein